MSKVGIFSGTFDPVHVGHLTFAQEAIEQCGLEKVFFMVEPHPRRKQGVRALEHRQAMTKRAIVHEPHFSNLIIDQSRFSVAHTLPLLQARFKGAELHFLMGEDFLSHLAHWPHIEDLIKNVSFVIGLRHHTAEEVKAQILLLQKVRGLKFSYKLFKTEAANYSSTSIRMAFKRGKAPEGLPSNVLAYIKQHKLYAVE